MQMSLPLDVNHSWMLIINHGRMIPDHTAISYSRHRTEIATPRDLVSFPQITLKW